MKIFAYEAGKSGTHRSTSYLEVIFSIELEIVQMKDSC